MRPQNKCVIFLLLILLQIVREGETEYLERVVFPIPPVCSYLTKDTKDKVFRTTESDEEGSKVINFFEQKDELMYEMEWQQNLISKTETYLNYFFHLARTNIGK